jgi:probable HAF family extracellular repeat protein
MKRIVNAVLLLCAVTAMAGRPIAAVAQQYTVTVIDAPGPSADTFGSGLNASGEVVGTIEQDNLPIESFLYSNGTMQDLGTLVAVFRDAVDTHTVGVACRARQLRF